MTTIRVPDGRVSVPDHADPAETAALAAAIGAYLQETGRKPAADAADAWHGRRWQFAGRTEALSGTARRVPAVAPRDEWTAAARLEGLD